MQKLVWAIALSSLTFSGFAARGECIEMAPLCHAMHEMSGAMECLTGQLPSFMCDGGDATAIQALKENAVNARKALIANQPAGTAPEIIASINATFDQLDQAIAELQAAGTDAAAKAQAIQKIKAIEKQAHATFRS